MRKNTKIQAFTLGEMIVVLILTSMVVGLAFSVLILVQKHMGSIQEHLNRNSSLDKLETALWIDFNRYPTIEYDAVEDKLICRSEINVTYYTFHEDYLIKDVDTFRVALDQKSLYFNGENIEQGKIDALKLTTSKTFNNKSLFVFKQTDANSFMK